MDRTRLVKLEIAFDGLQIILILEQVDPLQHISLLDETGTQNAIPRPFLVDGSLYGHGRSFYEDIKVLAPAHYGVFDGDVQVGELTSGSFAPTLDAGLALGYLQLDRANAETLDIAVRKRRIAAAVSKRPFYKRP